MEIINQIDKTIKRNTGLLLSQLEQSIDLSNRDKTTIKHYINQIGKDIKLSVYEACNGNQ